MVHIPVLQKEVLEYLDPKPNENFIDGTIGEAGHTLAILEKNKSEGKVLGIEWDVKLYENLLQSNIKRLVLVNDSYLNLREIVERKKFKPVSGILLDLGMSSWHLEKSERGFSFSRNEKLDMRYNFDNPLTAEKILNFWPEAKIERILREFGEEKFAKRIVGNIAKERKNKLIQTTFQLAEIIKRAVPKNYEKGRIQPSTRTFQALRVAVNNELSNLEKTLPQVLEILEPGGRLVIISFHSLEDRIVKNFLREASQKGLLKILTKKPIRSSFEEIGINPRSRSAKLRAVLKNE